MQILINKIPNASDFTNLIGMQSLYTNWTYSVHLCPQHILFSL